MTISFHYLDYAHIESIDDIPEIILEDTCSTEAAVGYGSLHDANNSLRIYSLH